MRTTARKSLKFSTIVADPPWPYKSRGLASSKEHRPNSHGAAPSSVERYGSMTMDELKALRLSNLVADKAHLYLWTTNMFMVEAHELAITWGFTPKSIITWGKIKSDGSPSMKTGYYFRGATEHIIFCTKGNLKLSGSKARPTLYLSERLPHSVKPPWFYDLVKEASPDPVLELFARRRRKGWYHWGNEVRCDVIL